MKLRPYQRDAIDAVRDVWDGGQPNALLVLATGLGKTVMFTGLGRELRAEGIGKTLVLAHRGELLEQARAKWLEMEPDAIVGIYQGARREAWADVIVASVQSCYPDVVDAEGNVTKKGRLAELPLADIGLVIADECFPRGTLIDGRPIETLRPGDVVRSWNHATGEVEPRAILRTFCSAPAGLVKVCLASGAEVIVTPGHPFYTAAGYVPAGELVHGVELYGADWTEGLHHLREYLPTEVMDYRHGPDVLASVQEDAARRQADAAGRDLPLVRSGYHRSGCSTNIVSPQGTGILLGGMCPGLQVGHIERDHGPDQQEVRIATDEGPQPDGRRGHAKACEPYAGGDGTPPTRTTRQWVWTHGVGAGDAQCCPWFNLESCRLHSDAAADAGALQDRRGAPSYQVGDRNRRSQPRRHEPEGKRCTQGRLFVVDRVDRVEVHQCSSEHGSGCLHLHDRVYNLEVDGNNNYFADGRLVHNCHHIAAESWMALIRAVREANPSALLLGVTATPYRADGQGLGMLFDRVAYRLGIADGIAQGYLCPLRGVRVQVELDLANVKTSKAGDYRDGDLGDRLDHAAIHQAIVEAWRREAGGRQTVCFSPTVDTATHLAEAFTADGVVAAVVSDRTPKKERAAILARYAAGEVQVVCNCAVLTEGWDSPRTSCVILARPTKSVGLYAQMVGRGTRLAEGKTDCLVLDVVGATALGLASLADLSEGKEGRAPGVDPEPEEEAPDEMQEEAPLGRTVQVKGVSTYEVDLFGGAVAWARVRGARIASLDIGHSVICYALPTGEWHAEAHRAGQVTPITTGPEAEVLRLAERYCLEHGKRHFLLPSDFLARRPASEKQVALLTGLIAQNRRVDAELAPKRPLLPEELPTPAALSMPAAGHWITYLRARLAAAKRRK